MKTFLIAFAAILFAAQAHAGSVYEVGDPVSNLCWNDETGKPFCLDDGKGTVRVLIFNAGWCGPCNEELEQLSPKVTQLKETNIVFLSLSVQGWKYGSTPTPEFLKQWKAKHKIPFRTLATPKQDLLKLFAPPIGIPSVAIIGKDGKLAYKEVGPEPDAVIEKAREFSARRED